MFFHVDSSKHKYVVLLFFFFFFTFLLIFKNTKHALPYAPSCAVFSLLTPGNGTTEGPTLALCSMRLCPGLGPCDLPSEVVSGLCLSSELAQVTLTLYLWHWLAPASPRPFPEVPASLPGAHVPQCAHTSQCISGQPRPSSAPQHLVPLLMVIPSGLGN